MPEERRGAVRFRVPDGVRADVGEVPVKLLDLSMIGAKVEHEERFPLASPKFSVTWEGTTVSIQIRVARSEIVGRRGSKLLYHTGIHFVSTDATAQGLIAAITRDPDAAPATVAPTPPPQTPPTPLDDSWTREVRFLRHELDDDHLPYAQFRLTPDGWQKDYVASPEQPPDGFTIPREQQDFHELQRTFETADPDTRRMMQIALESQLKR